MSNNRRLVRLATLLTDDEALPCPVAEPPAALWSSYCRSAELLTLTDERRWRKAGEVCRRELLSRLDQLRWGLEAMRAEVAEPVSSHRAAARDVYDDLVALGEEFPSLRIDLKTREIAVTTEPVTLDGVPLGPFDIVLDGANLDARSPYRIVARAPHYPTVDDTVPHPHVRDDELCEGDAAAPLRRALRERRLFDFFTIVAQTLGTYNASSAFVRLDEWSGITCRGCGDHCDPEDSSSCQRCSCDLCDDCGSCCDACEHLCCHDCAGPCHECECNVCGACQRRCSTCRKHFCQECIHDGLCSDCGEPAQDAPADDAPTEDTAAGDAQNAGPGTADAEVLADGVGQAGVLA
jgi:hypothetical protein